MSSGTKRPLTTAEQIAAARELLDEYDARRELLEGRLRALELLSTLSGRPMPLAGGRLGRRGRR